MDQEISEPVYNVQNEFIVLNIFVEFTGLKLTHDRPY